MDIAQIIENPDNYKHWTTSPASGGSMESSISIPASEFPEDKTMLIILIDSVNPQNMIEFSSVSVYSMKPGVNSDIYSDNRRYNAMVELDTGEQTLAPPGMNYDESLDEYYFEAYSGGFITVICITLD